jgi:WD40 repeat protein
VLSDTDCSCWLYARGYQAHQQSINSIAWASDNKSFATASDDGTVKTWKAGTWAHLKTFTDPNHAKVTSISWSPDGKLLLAGDSAGKVWAWQVA